MHAGGIEVEAKVTATSEAHTTLTLVQATTVPSASCGESLMVAEAAADNAMNADAAEVEGQMPATAKAHTALTLVQTAAASRVDSVMVAEAL